MNNSVFSLKNCIEILHSTPAVLAALLKGKSDIWTMKNEGENTWSPIMVLNHLVLAERDNWIPRIEIILSDSIDKTYKTFERQSETFEKKSMDELLREFSTIRAENLNILNSKRISNDDLNKTAVHPAFGKVTLSQQISTWSLHDLGHIAQICRVMAFQYKNEIGPWSEYLSIVKHT
ncbi:DinB family protein [Fulvivirga sp. M361]|uniref:DinB family protein n=1 Tax=Fulvivirga sp. M361 TaxID=2594266 RepID=UPI00117A8ED3|nr:DinB family protein [Fulvivirga sp. M361]TRX59363.1 DinB family protein [Fulvivirga sp. M361]